MKMPFRSRVGLIKVSMRRRTSSRDLVISANVGTARSITDTVCFGKRWVSWTIKLVILLSFTGVS